MYIAIVHMDRPITEREKAREIGLMSAKKFADAGKSGLLMKYYLSGQAGSGGVYVWKSKEYAEAWYTPEWYEYMRKTFAEPTVTFYDSVVQVDNINHKIVADGLPAFPGH